MLVEELRQPALPAVGGLKGVPPARCFDSSVVSSGKEFIYIGRGWPAKGLGPSPWGNPFRVRGKVKRSEAVRSYEGFLRGSPSLLASLRELDATFLASLRELDACSMLCHCAAHLECHGDVLQRVYQELLLPVAGPTEPVFDTRPDFSTQEVPQEVHIGNDESEPFSREVHVGGAEAFEEMRPEGFEKTAMVSHGPQPVQVPGRHGLRDLHDGAGLCSPGRFAKGDRLYPEGFDPFREVWEAAVKVFAEELQAKGSNLKVFLFSLAVRRAAFDRFRADRRVPVSWADLPFKVLRRLLSDAESFRAEVVAHKRRGAPVPDARGRAGRPRLRDRDPW